MINKQSLSTNKTHKQHIHFVGIKGVGMTALAILAKQKGYQVTGSDVADDFTTAEVLKKFKITPLLGFKKENLTNLPDLPDLAVVTGAHGGLNNPEAEAAKEMGVKVLLHGQALAEFTKDTQLIAVSGSHGKTTVSAMIAHILTKAGLDPSFAIGCGDIKSLGSPGHFGKGDYFVAEADEYLKRFLSLNPEVGVITNIEYDHPDAYQNLEELKLAFCEFAQKIKKNGLLIAGFDNENVRQLLSKIKVPVLTYGFSPLSDYQISRLSYGAEVTWFNLKYQGTDLGQFTLSVCGKHNSQNAVAAAIAANYLGLSWNEIKKQLSTFSGTSRRFEKKGEKDRVKFYDDYAHHPTQIKATLEAARAWFGKKRIIAVFQPHTFSRTKALFEEFSRCFNSADLVIITKIYASARENDDQTISAQMLVNNLLKYQNEVIYLETLDEAVEYLKRQLKHEDIVITMGAGDICKIHERIK